MNHPLEVHVQISAREYPYLVVGVYVEFVALQDHQSSLIMAIQGSQLKAVPPVLHRKKERELKVE